MTLPPGLPHTSDHVGKLRKVLYGLKQAPRALFTKFNTVILRFVSHKPITIQPSFSLLLPLARSLTIYIDDMIITGDDGMTLLISGLPKHININNLR